MAVIRETPTILQDEEVQCKSNPRRMKPAGIFLSLAGCDTGLFLPQNGKTMLTLPYLKSILIHDGLHELDGIEDENQILECRAGMGGAIKLIQEKGLPVAMVMEHPERHSLSLRNWGGFHECTPSIWIMERVAYDETAESVMARCYERYRKFFTVLVKHFEDDQLEGWRENAELTAYDREAGSYVGYEVFINFRENEDLSYDAGQ